MNDHCPDCGVKLLEPRDLRHHWLRLLRCPSCSAGYFLEVADSRWIFPMLRLEPGVSKKLLDADDALLRTAVERIRRIDCKTLSIVDFEHTLLGCYDPSRTYRIVYPDGSEK
jgi:hypothetical protein